MMSQINIYIKNTTPIKILLVLIFYVTTIYAQNYNANSGKIKNKQQSLDNIDLEIELLENQLKLELNSQNNASEKSKKIEQEIVKEKNNLLNSKDEKEYYEKLLIRAQFILDSLNTSLQNTKGHKKKVNETISKIIKQQDRTKNELNKLNADIDFIDQSIDLTRNKLGSIKQTVQNMVREAIMLNKPTDMQFLLESNTWNTFIVNSTLYQLLIKDQKQTFDNLIIKQTKFHEQYLADSLMKTNLIEEEIKLIKREVDYQKQLKNFKDYQKILNDLIDNKTSFLNKLMSEYQSIGLNLNQTQQNIISLEEKLNSINNKNVVSLESQKKIQSQLQMKKESRELIRKEIYKLIKTQKVFEGKPIKKLRGKLPWPIDGKVITKFGKHTNPNTKVIINYDLIEIMPIMNKEEKIIYYANQINPQNPNKKMVQKFQKFSMNMKRGDRGFGVFGPQTTKTWKKYNAINRELEKEPIYSIYNGVIESISFINPIVGVVAIVRHDNGYFSVYNGNIEMLVLENSVVKTGMQIGTINKQNILSFQLWNNKIPIDPEKWLIKK